MDTVSISSKTPIDLESLANPLGQRWQIEGAGQGGLVVQESSRRVYLNVEPSDKRQLLIDYSDIELVKKVLELIADNPEYIVDNDHGTVLPGNQMVQRIKLDPFWNWRADQGEI